VFSSVVFKNEASSTPKPLTFRFSWQLMTGTVEYRLDPQLLSVSPFFLIPLVGSTAPPAKKSDFSLINSRRKRKCLDFLPPNIIFSLYGVPVGLQVSYFSFALTLPSS